MDSTSRSGYAYGGCSEHLLVEDEGIMLYDIPEEEEYEDDVLPYHRPSTPDKSDKATPLPLVSTPFVSIRLSILVLAVFGTFLGTCPLPRKYMSGYFLRQMFIAFVASLVTFPSSWARVLLSSPKRKRRILMAYFGFYLSMYAISIAADEVHMEM